jgi:hypothetical protein
MPLGERLVVHEGPVSVILQADAGIKCAHNWRLASCFGKGIRGYSGVGHFLDQDTIVSVLESTNGFSVPTVPPARNAFIEDLRIIVGSSSERGWESARESLYRQIESALASQPGG